MTGHQPFSELSDGLRRRLADRDAERERIWTAIQSWTEIARRLDDDGRPVAVEGTEFQPLAPFFKELRAMVFPREGGNVSEGDPWSVAFRPKQDTVRLRVGDFTIELSALSAHKLGSALHAASGIDTGVDEEEGAMVTPEEMGNPDWYSDSELSADEPEPSHHIPDAEMGGEKPVGMALRGSARPVQTTGGTADAVRTEGVEREALEGQHAQDDTWITCPRCGRTSFCGACHDWTDDDLPDATMGTKAYEPWIRRWWRWAWKAAQRPRP